MTAGIMVGVYYSVLRGILFTKIKDFNSFLLSLSTTLGAAVFGCEAT